MANWLTQLFGSRNQRLLNGYSKNVSRTNALEATFKALSDEQLQGKTDEFRQRLGGRRERSTICCPRRSRRSAKRRGARWACGISMCSSSAA